MESKGSSFSLQGAYNQYDSWFSGKKRNLDSTDSTDSTAWNESSGSWYDQSSATTPGGSTWYKKCYTSDQSSAASPAGSTWYEKWNTSNRVSLRERIRWKKAGWIEYINDWWERKGVGRYCDGECAVRGEKRAFPFHWCGTRGVTWFPPLVPCVLFFLWGSYNKPRNWISISNLSGEKNPGNPII